MKRQLHYISQGRGGTVVYRDSISTINFDYEFGGGNCVAIIFVPTTDEWVAQTKRPLADREAIIQFVAAQSLNDQVSGGHYKITYNAIELFSGR